MEKVNNEEEDYLDDYPHCPICLDIYGINLQDIKAPKIIDCGDSICKECLQDLIRRKNKNCPICKKEIINNENIDKYITNKQLVQLVNSFFNLPKTEAEKQEGSKKPKEYKIITLGSTGVGKTSVFLRLIKETFQDDLQTTINLKIYDDYYIKYKKKKYKLNFYDTSGSERYNAFTRNYLRNSDGIIFVYDITNKKTFDDLESWYNMYQEEKKEVIGILIGNKCDKQRIVNYKDAEKFAKKYNLKYMETSARLDKGIKKALIYLLDHIIESKAIYTRIDSIETNDNFHLDSKTLKEEKEESIWKKICKKLSFKK